MYIKIGRSLLNQLHQIFYPNKVVLTTKVIKYINKSVNRNKEILQTIN